MFLLAGSVFAVSSVFLSPLLFWSSFLLWFFLLWFSSFLLGSFGLLYLFLRALSLRSPSLSLSAFAVLCRLFAVFFFSTSVLAVSFPLPLRFCCTLSSFRCVLLFCLFPFYSSPTLFGSPSVCSCCSFLLSAVLSAVLSIFLSIFLFDF